VEERIPIEEKTLRLVKEHGFCEYHNPFTGEAYGAKGGFSWTAALTLVWLSLIGEDEDSDR
jgi:hypothetical protein